MIARVHLDNDELVTIDHIHQNTKYFIGAIPCQITQLSIDIGFIEVFHRLIVRQPGFRSCLIETIIGSDEVPFCQSHTISKEGHIPGQVIVLDQIPGVSFNLRSALTNDRIACTIQQVVIAFCIDRGIRECFCIGSIDGQISIEFFRRPLRSSSIIPTSVGDIPMIVEIRSIHIASTRDTIDTARRGILPDGALTTFIDKSIVSTIVCNPDIKSILKNTIVIHVILDHVVIGIEDGKISTTLDSFQSIQNQICIGFLLGSILEVIRFKVPSHRISDIKTRELIDTQIHFCINLSFIVTVCENVDTIRNTSSLSTLHILNQVFIHIGTICVSSRDSTNECKLNILRVSLHLIPVDIILVFRYVNASNLGGIVTRIYRRIHSSSTTLSKSDLGIIDHNIDQSPIFQHRFIPVVIHDAGPRLSGSSECGTQLQLRDCLTRIGLRIIVDAFHNGGQSATRGKSRQQIFPRDIFNTDTIGRNPIVFPTYLDAIPGLIIQSQIRLRMDRSPTIGRQDRIGDIERIRRIIQSSLRRNHCHLTINLGFRNGTIGTAAIPDHGSPIEISIGMTESPPGIIRSHIGVIGNVGSSILQISQIRIDICGAEILHVSNTDGEIRILLQITRSSTIIHLPIQRSTSGVI